MLSCCLSGFVGLCGVVAVVVVVVFVFVCVWLVGFVLLWASFCV